MSRRHVIPKACSLFLVACDNDLAVFLSDPLHVSSTLHCTACVLNLITSAAQVHAFVCLCCNCLKLHNASRDMSTPKIRLLLKKPNASPHYSKAALSGKLRRCLILSLARPSYGCKPFSLNQFGCLQQQMGTGAQFLMTSAQATVP